MAPCRGHIKHDHFSSLLGLYYTKCKIVSNKDPEIEKDVGRGYVGWRQRSGFRARLESSKQQKGLGEGVRMRA